MHVEDAPEETAPDTETEQPKASEEAVPAESEMAEPAAEEWDRKPNGQPSAPRPALKQGNPFPFRIGEPGRPSSQERLGALNRRNPIRRI